MLIFEACLHCQRQDVALDVSLLRLLDPGHFFWATLFLLIFSKKNYSATQC